MVLHQREVKGDVGDNHFGYPSFVGKLLLKQLMFHLLLKL
jgi:hypothetical protein